MRQYHDQINLKYKNSSTGNVGAGKPVTVFNVGTTNKATLFNSDLEEIANPVSADDIGNYTFNIEDGTYDIYIDYNLPTQVSNLNVQIANIVDNPPLSPSDNVIAFDTLDAAVNETSQLKIFNGAALNLKERTLGNGGGAMWDAVDASTVTPNGYNIVQCVGVPNLALVLRNKAVMGVLSFGAIPGTNSEGALQAAHDSGASMVSYEGKLFYANTPINIKQNTNGFGGGIARENTTAVTEEIVTIDTDNITVYELVVDGQATTTSGVPNQDPVFDSTNYNSFLGGKIGFRIKDCDNVSLIKCYGNNTAGFSGIRIQDSTNIKLDGCVTKRTRGTFGDGVYIVNSKNVKIRACESYDHTRIGFVCETGSFNISHVACLAKDGHDQSISYGGNELNRGFWAENSTNINYTHCLAENQWSGGFICTTTNKSENIPPNTNMFSFSLVGCTSRNITLPAGKSGGATAGFRMASLALVGAVFSVNGCASYNSEQGFNSVGLNPKDIYNYSGCYAEVTGDTPNSFVFFNDNGADSNNESVVNIVDCSGMLMDTSRKYITNENTCDIGGFSPIRNNINIVRYTNKDDGICSVKNLSKNDSTLTVRGGGGSDNFWFYLNVRNVQTNLDSITLTGPTFNKIGPTAVSAGSELILNNSIIKQELRVTDTRFSGKNNKIETGKIRHDIISHPLPANVLFNVGVDIEADISAVTGFVDSPVRFSYVAGSPSPIVSGVWKNTGELATGNSGFVGFNGSQVLVYANSVVSDDSVEFQVSDGFGSPVPYNFSAGSQVIPM